MTIPNNTLPLHVQMAQAFASLPSAYRTQFYLPKILIKEALEQNDTEAARHILTTLVVPPELEAVKQLLLNLIES
jgi:hypothetical protein